MNTVELIVGLLASGGFMAAIAGTIKAVLDHRRGVQSDEGAAEDRHMKRLEDRIQKLEEQIAKKDQDYNELFREYTTLVQENYTTERYVNSLIALLNASGLVPPTRQ